MNHLIVDRYEMGQFEDGLYSPASANAIDAIAAYVQARVDI